MTPQIDFIAVVYLIGATQGIFLVVALLDQKLANRKANIFLAFFLMIFTTSLIDEFLFRSFYFSNYPHLIGLIWPFEYLYGPLFYFYIQALVSEKGLLNKIKSYRHFILFGIGFILALPTWILDGSEKMVMLYAIGTPTEAVLRANMADTIASLLLVLQIIVYIVLSLNYLRRHFSSFEANELVWIKRLLWLVIPLWMLYLIDIFFSHALGIGDDAGVVLHIMVVLIIYGMGYMGLRHAKIFNQQVSAPLANDKYLKSKLPEEERQKIEARLLRIMEEDQPYLDGEMTLAGLADLVGCSSNHLSQVLNAAFQKNFFDFMNGYRVQQAKAYLLDAQSETMTILAIALEAGFNSKSAFYTAFKKEVGMTPSQYKKSQL